MWFFPLDGDRAKGRLGAWMQLKRRDRRVRLLVDHGVGHDVRTGIGGVVQARQELLLTPVKIGFVETFPGAERQRRNEVLDGWQLGRNAASQVYVCHLRGSAFID